MENRIARQGQCWPSTEPALRQSLGQAGRVYAETHLDRDAVLQCFEARLMRARPHA